MKNFEKQSNRKHIPHTDWEYLAERKRAQEKARNDFFGEGEARAYEQERHLAEKLRQQTEDLQTEMLSANLEDQKRYEEAIRDNLNKISNLERNGGDSLRHEFKKLAINFAILRDRKNVMDPDTAMYLWKELRELFDAPEILDEAKKYFGDDELKATENFISKAYAGELPVMFLYNTIKLRSKRMEQRREQFKQFTNECVEDFKNSVQNAVENGEIPESAAAALPRIDTVRFQLRDRLAWFLSKAEGSAHDSAGIITASSELFQPDKLDELRHTIFHELLHELSGKAISTGGESGIRIKKLGLAIKGTEGKSFVWLNEAVTERLAMQLSQHRVNAEFSYKGSGAYAIERRELDRLIESGLDTALLLNAYFENLTNDQPKAERGKYFAALVQKVNELEGERGFTKIENKHILDSIAMGLLDYGAYPLVSAFPDPTKLEKGTKIITAEIHVGARDDTRESTRFIYIINPDERNILQNNRWREAERYLAYLREKYGETKVNYSVSEEVVG